MKPPKNKSISEQIMLFRHLYIILYGTDVQYNNIYYSADVFNDCYEVDGCTV